MNVLREAISEAVRRPVVFLWGAAISLAFILPFLRYVV